MFPQAMKMEINLEAPEDLVGQTVEAIIAKPGSSVNTGDVVIAARKK
jgi:biotin carboxyl carrier protein